MCGIAGLLQLEGTPVQPAQLRRMADLLRHRGPDDEGFVFFNPVTGEAQALKGPDSPAGVVLPDIRAADPGALQPALGLAERRLAILDLSPAGHTPMQTPDGRLTIAFNGEIFNYLELRETLRGYGHAFQSAGDTEVLLAAYREWGPACVDRFNGMWAFALWDAAERRLFCSRDRFGVKPFYYVEQGGLFAFASEPKALWAAGVCAASVQPDILTDYLAGYEASDPAATMFRDIRQLPGGHNLVAQGGRVRVERYWELPCNTDIGPDELDPAVIHRIYELLLDAVRLRLRADVPVGSCLSGGLDSSAVVALINRLMREEHHLTGSIGARQKTFTACYADPGSDERRFAEQVVQQTGADWRQTFPTAETLLADLERFVWQHDEPPITPSMYAQWCVMREVRACGVTVTLDGQGADELLAGYLPYDIYFAQLARAGAWARLAREVNGLRAVGSRAWRPMLMRAGARLLPVAIQRSLQLRASPRLAGLTPDAAEAAVRRHQALFDAGRQANLPRHLQALAQHNLPRLLRSEDRNSMAFSIEARTPFLDVRLAEYVSQLPAAYRIHHGWSKAALRRALEGALPAAIVWRRDKKGFATPEAEWMNALRPTWRELLHPRARLAEHLDLQPILAALSADAGAHSGLASALWRWGAAEMWLQQISRQDAGFGRPSQR